MKRAMAERRMTGRRPKATHMGNHMKKPTPMSSVGHEAKVSTVNGAISYSPVSANITCTRSKLVLMNSK